MANKIKVVILIGLFLIGMIFVGDPLFEFLKLQERTEGMKKPDISRLWKGIIGEAIGEGYCGMYAVACCYRNRIEKGMRLGCVALHRPDLDGFVKREGRYAEKLAKKIIRELFEADEKDITNGATHYENIEKYGTPYWVGQDKMVICAKIGPHTFYKIPKN